MSQGDTSKWQILYPNYLDATKTIPQGRRITKTQAVDSPDVREMAEICDFLKIPNVVEIEKCYPRDWMIRGRLRVCLVTLGDMGQRIYTHSEIHNKVQLLRKMGQLIPKLKSRTNAAAQQQQASSSSSGGQTQQAIENSNSSAQAGGQQQQSSAAQNNNKKKNNKKKKK